VRLIPLAAIAVCCASPVNAMSYQVGPGKIHQTLQQVTDLLEPGDVVEVAGDATYPGDVTLTKSGTAEHPITIRGLRRNGRRPVISGGSIGVHFDRANYGILEGFEIEGASARGIRHRGAFNVIRDTYVHDCPDQGILGSDTMSGSLTLEYVEVARCGGPPGGHQVYVSTDPVAFPGAVFRMQHCYIHDASWGNAVKTRCERNEIYYNWVESNSLRALVLIGRDQEAGPRPMHSDVVGNVLINGSDLPVVQLGHDGRYFGSRGRYRLVNNTFLLSEECPTAIQARWQLESVQMHNNVFYRLGGEPIEILNEDTADWTTGERICAGRHNWVAEGATCPPEWTGTIVGSDPGFTNLAGYDLHLAPRSPLIGAGTRDFAGAPGYPFPDPLPRPAFIPPSRGVETVGSARPRSAESTVDIGAFPFEPSAGDAGQAE
jgi:hypothetical protein